MNQIFMWHVWNVGVARQPLKFGIKECSLNFNEIMKNYYIVQKIGYEYDDEIYNRSSEDGGKPVRVFESEELAQNHCHDLEIEHLRELCLGEYGYDLDEIFDDLSDKKLIAFLKTKCGFDIETDACYNLKIPKNATDKQLGELMNRLRLKFFTVVKCEGE